MRIRLLVSFSRCLTTCLLRGEKGGKKGGKKGGRSRDEVLMRQCLLRELYAAKLQV